MDKRRLQLARAIVSGRLQAIVTGEQHRLLGFEYIPSEVYLTYESDTWRATILKRAEDILLEAFGERVLD